MRILSQPKTESIILRPSVAAFLSRNKADMMYHRPWGEQIAWEDRRFRAQYRDDHPSYAARWALHQLKQAQYIETMATYHSGSSPQDLAELGRRQRAEYSEQSSALWAAVVWGEKREVREIAA